MPMVGSSSFELNRGAWTAEEDELLVTYMESHGINTGGWAALPKKAGLRRSGKSCRFRWMNHLRPNINHGDISPEEEDLIIRLHRLLGNRWSLIAGRLPGRTDNQIKNYWNTHLSTRKSETCEQKREKRGRPSRTKAPRPPESVPPDFEQYQSNSYEEYGACSPGLLGFSSFSDFNQSSPDLHWVANSYLDAHIIDLLNPVFSGMIPSELCLTFDAESENHGLPSC